jgi:hypothetical protein
MLNSIAKIAPCVQNGESAERDMHRKLCMCYKRALYHTRDHPHFQQR